MRKLFAPLLIVTAAMFVYAPVMIAQAPYESTMLLIQKIFYFHVPSWIAMYGAIFVCGIESAIFLFRRKPSAERVASAAAELAVLFGLFGLVTGPLWGRKAWGVWWQWDARLTTSLLLELIFVGYLLVRKYGGPGSDKLAAAIGIFGMANVPFVYKSVDIWRTVHPQTSVVPLLLTSAPGMAAPFAFCAMAFILLLVLLLALRVGLEHQRAALDQLYLAEE